MAVRVEQGDVSVDDVCMCLCYDEDPRRPFWRSCPTNLCERADHDHDATAYYEKVYSMTAAGQMEELRKRFAVAWNAWLDALKVKT